MPGLMSGLYLGGNDLIGSKDKTSPWDNLEDSVFSGFDESDADDDDLYENPQPVRGSRKRAHSPSDGAPKKRAKVPGGRPAINKLVTEDLDSDDQRIVELKFQGYVEARIIEKLKEENRTHYKPGAVSSRYARIRKLLATKEEERLDDELSDWHLGEDDLLRDSVRIADEKYQLDVQRLIEKKWENVSRILTEKMEEKKYTAKASNERWEGLQAGTALGPIELDPDQEGRKEMREARIAENKRQRAEAKAAIQRARDAERKAKEDKQRAKKDKETAREEAKQAREAEKAELQRISAERKAGKLRKMQEREEARKAWKAEIDEKRHIRELEERIYRNITGKALNRVRRITGNDESIVGDVQGFSDDEHDDDADDEGAGDHQLPDRTTDSDDREDDGADMSDVRSDHDSDQFPDGTDDDDEADDADEANVDRNSEVTSLESKVNLPTPSSTPPTPDETICTAVLNNPRYIMTIFELDDLLRRRQKPRVGAQESHAQVVARLDAEDRKLKSAELTDMLKARFAEGAKTGKKDDKIRSLQEDDAKKSAAGKARIAENEGVEDTKPTALDAGTESTEDTKDTLAEVPVTPEDDHDDT